jgi:hypothetical protein
MASVRYIVNDLDAAAAFYTEGVSGEMISPMFQLARDGATDGKGRPSLLQLALTARELRDAAHVIKTPLAVQSALFAILTPIARMRGHRPLREYRYDGIARQSRPEGSLSCTDARA